MKIIVAGGTGFIGSHLCQTLITQKHEVTVISRNLHRASRILPSPIHIMEWDTKSPQGLELAISGADAVVNVMGEPIADRRWTARRKQHLITSRIETTRLLVEALRLTSQKPRTLINASGIGFYGPQAKQALTEEAPRGRGFLSDLCVAWEAAAKEAEELGIRVVLPRIGMVLGRTGGALPKMLRPVQVVYRWPHRTWQPTDFLDSSKRSFGIARLAHWKTRDFRTGECGFA